MEWTLYEKEKRKADALRAKLEAQQKQIADAEEVLQKKHARAEARRLKHVEKGVRVVRR